MKKIRNEGKHLDLGCGKFPRNPYDRQFLYGVDIRDIDFNEKLSFEYKKANLITQKIPYPDSYFASVSAFDFLEHVPRVWIKDDGSTSFPFIDLMSEIYRVLEPGGKIYALTPFYPRAEVFQDPTHVNFISKDTHKYFCGAKPFAKIYGFEGTFKCLRASRVAPISAMEGLDGGIKQAFRHLRKFVKNRLTHLIWEFEAIK